MASQRHPWSFSLAISALLVGLAWPLASLAQVQKCVDSATGAITFSDRGCSTGENITTVRVHPVNSIEGAPYRQQASELTQFHDSPKPERKGTRLTIVGENNDADRERRKLCKEASTPYKGLDGLTASQRVAAAQLCAGIALPAPVAKNAPRPMPAPAAPAGMASCDASGCWGTDGQRYNRGAGATHFPASGGPACQLIHGKMNCP